MQNLVLALLCRIRKTHVFKPQSLRKSLEAGRVVHFLDVVFGVEETEDRRRRAHRLLEEVIEVRKLTHRIVELEEQNNECAKHAHGHAAVQNLVAADEQKHRDGNRTHCIH